MRSIDVVRPLCKDADACACGGFVVTVTYHLRRLPSSTWSSMEL